MGKLEGTIKSEIVRLAKKEIRKTLIPLGRDVRSLKSTVSRLRKTVLALGRLAAQQQKELKKRKVPLEATREEVKKERLFLTGRRVRWYLFRWARFGSSRSFRIGLPEILASGRRGFRRGFVAANT